jgi:hypothetical protein
VSGKGGIKYTEEKMFASLFKAVQTRFIARPAFNLIQTADFSKYISNARKKRLPMTTKRAGKGFYKGNGCRKEGVISSKGNRCSLISSIVSFIVRV